MQIHFLNINLKQSTTNINGGCKTTEEAFLSSTDMKCGYNANLQYVRYDMN